MKVRHHVMEMFLIDLAKQLITYLYDSEQTPNGSK